MFLVAEIPVMFNASPSLLFSAMIFGCFVFDECVFLASCELFRKTENVKVHVHAVARRYHHRVRIRRHVISMVYMSAFLNHLNSRPCAMERYFETGAENLCFHLHCFAQQNWF